jgi:hypothetical protein
MPCSICTHVDREAIAQALARSDSYRTIAARYGVTKSTLARHTKVCLPVRLPVGQATAEAPMGHPTAPAHLVNAPVHQAALQLYTLLVDRRTPVDTRLAVAEVVRLLLQIVQDSEG